MGRWRYLLLEELSEEPMDGGQLLDALRRSLRELFGCMGLIEASPRLLYHSGRYSVIRCPSDEVDRIRASLIFASDASRGPIAVRVKRSSGTLRALKPSLSSGGMGGDQPG